MVIAVLRIAVDSRDRSERATNPPASQQSSAVEEIGRWLATNVGTWISAGFVASVVSWISTNFWERRKLTRGERATANANFLDASSRRWRAFADRDSAAKSGNVEMLESVKLRIVSTRDGQYAAYTAIQVLVTPATVEAALDVMNAYHSRNVNFNSPGSAPKLGNDRRSEMLAKLVECSRLDLGRAALDRKELARISRAWSSPSGT